MPKRCRHLQIFNEEIAPIKGAALAVKREHEGQRERKKEWKEAQQDETEERPSQEKWAHLVATSHGGEEQTKRKNKDDTG